MLKKITIGLLSSALVFTISCTSSEKSSVENDPNIQHSDINFDPLGSDSGKINGLGTINFEYDKSRLTSEAREILAKNADWIRANKNVTVQIEGHCDGRGSVEYNLALGERRAKSVKTYLVSLGISDKRMTIISYGKERPVDQGDSEEAYNKNRRANFVPLPN